MKKLLAVLLSLCLVVGMVPMMAFADDGAAASSDWVYGPDYPAWYVGEDGYDWSEYWKSLDMDERDAYEWWLQHGGHWGDWYWKDAVVYVGNTPYTSLKAAMDANEGGCTLNLYGDVSYNGILDLTNYNIVGNGHTVYCDNEVKVNGSTLTEVTIRANEGITVTGGTVYLDSVSVRGNNGYDVTVTGDATLYVYDDCNIDSVLIERDVEWSGRLPNRLTETTLSNGDALYTSDASYYTVATLNGVSYGSLEEALAAATSANDNVVLVRSETVNDDIEVPTNVRLTINPGVTLRVRGGLLDVDGRVFNYGTIDAAVDGDISVWNYVDINTTPRGASVSLYESRDQWHYGDELKYANAPGEYWVDNGWYYYVVSENGYVAEADWIYVDNAAVTINVSLDERDDDYRVYVEDTTHGDISVDKTRAEEGDWVYITVDPDVGYVLTGITVTKPNGSTVKVERVRENYYRFEMPGTRVTVDASFSRHVTPFTDIRLADWYYEAVSYVYFNGLMEGVTDTEFAPNAATSRAMVVQILYRMSGSPSVSGSAGFTDVASGAWYATAVNWAADRGIVEGRTASTFDPNAAVTREELATMLYRYARFKGYNVSVGENTNILSYNDVNQVSDYAYSAMQWACGTGIIDGTSSGYLTPQGGATRAQLAAMLMRFCNEYVD